MNVDQIKEFRDFSFLKMAHATRSKISTTTGANTVPIMTSSVSHAPLTAAEAEIMHKTLEDRENLIREQAGALRREREDFEKRQMGSLDLGAVIQALKQLQDDISPLKNLRDRFENLEQRINETSQPPSLLELPDAPVQPIPAVLKIKDVLPNIPTYDGYKISVFQFSRACERARDLLAPSQESQLVQLIINKLEGDAYQVVEGNYYDSVTGLLDKLKTIFAPGKTVSQYRGELANIFKLPNETVLKYAGRIKDLRTAILDCYRRQKGNVDRIFSEEIDSEILEAFVNGLPSELITRIEHRPVGNLDQAIEYAVKISRTLEAERAREKFHSPRAPVEHKPPRADTYQLPPVKILTRPSDAPRPFIRPLIPGQPGPNSPNVCRYCKFPGHDISACRKLAYKNAQQSSGNVQKYPESTGANQGTSQITQRLETISSQPSTSHEKKVTIREQ